jgi:hypothetical protein
MITPIAVIIADAVPNRTTHAGAVDDAADDAVKATLNMKAILQGEYPIVHDKSISYTAPLHQLLQRRAKHLQRNIHTDLQHGPAPLPQLPQHERECQASSGAAQSPVYRGPGHAGAGHRGLMAALAVDAFVAS